MSRKKGKPRRVQYANPRAFLAVLARVAPVDACVATGLEVKVRMAYERLRSGAGTPSDYDRVARAMNVAYERAKDEDITGREVLQEALGATGNALEAARERYDQTGRFGFTGEQLTALNEGMDVYAELLRNSSALQMHRADDRVERWVRRLEQRRAA
jgi:hypothetical protein